MTELITNFFQTLFGDNVVLATILIAMIPLIELKGAIPFGTSVAFWPAGALTAWQAFGWALLGSSLVVPLVAVCFQPLYDWMKGKKFFNKIADFLVGDVVKRSGNEVGRGFWWRVLTVVLFVAFPVPLTGVWTGTCFAILLGLNFWQTCVCVIAGNTVCGVIVTAVCLVAPQATNYFLYAFLAIILVAVVIKVILHLTRRQKAVEGVPEP